MQVSKTVRGIFENDIKLDDLKIPFKFKTAGDDEAASGDTTSSVPISPKEENSGVLEDGPPGPLTKEQVAKYRIEMAKADRMKSLGILDEYIKQRDAKKEI